MAWESDGETDFDVAQKGRNTRFGGCKTVVRNRSRPITFRVSFVDGIISISLKVQEDGAYLKCAKKVDADGLLQPGKFIGFSAAKGDLGSDVYKISRHQMEP